MLQENPGSITSSAAADTPGLAWEGPVLQQGVEFVFELAAAIKARAGFARGYERWEFIPLNISTGEVDIKLLPANRLRVDLLSRGTSFNKLGRSRWNAVYNANERWADEHPEGPHLELHIHFAGNHFARGERIDWDRFAYDYGLKSDNHLQIWPPQQSQSPQ